MKVKIVNKDKSQTVEIPADKVLVISDKRTDDLNHMENDTYSFARFVDDKEGIPEFEPTSDGTVCFFYDPVVILDLEADEQQHNDIYSTGTFMWVSVGGNFTEGGNFLESSYTREEGDALIVTTPRGYIQLRVPSEEDKEDDNFCNFLIEFDLGNFIEQRVGLFDDAMFAQVRSFINVPREAGKSYSHHTPSSWNKLFMLNALQSPKFRNHPNSALPGYWDNIALLGL